MIKKSYQLQSFERFFLLMLNQNSTYYAQFLSNETGSVTTNVVFHPLDFS